MKINHMPWQWVAWAILGISYLLMLPRAEAFGQHIRDVVVFQGGKGGSSHYRIPSMVVANDGSLVAFAEGRAKSGDPGQGHPISIRSRRSTDNGRTWSGYRLIHETPGKAYSDPRPMVDRLTGRIFLFYTRWDKKCAQHRNCVPFDDPRHGLLYRTSDDHGQTWSDAVNVFDQVRDKNWYANGSSSSDGRATWSATPGQQHIKDAGRLGWSLSWNSRVAHGACNVQYFANGKKRFLVDLQVRRDNSVRAVLVADEGNIEVPLGFDISAYHDYQLVGDGTSASFYVDGVQVSGSWPGQSSSGRTVTWGNGCSSIKGGSAYHSIDFSINGVTRFGFDASLMKRVNGRVIRHPGEQGWSKTGASNGKGDPGWKSINAGPGQGIQLDSGRLIFPAIVRDAFTQFSVVSVYSDDHGETWQSGNQTPTFAVQPTESDMVQLDDGRLLLSTRNDGGSGVGYFNRYHFISEDQGVSWTMVAENRNSINGALFFKLARVDIGLAKLSDGRLLMSGPQGQSAVSSDRNNLAIWSAVENSLGLYNFAHRTQFRSGYTGYSDLVELQDNGPSGNENVGVLYEGIKGRDIRFMVIDADQIR